jgi:AcrR family transcriptional regulator
VNNVNIPKRSYHHGNLRAALLQATLRAIAEDGPDGFTLRDVARRAGVSPAAPYRHFRDKDELLAAVAAECADRLGRMVAAAVAEAPPDDPLAQFRQVGIASVEFAVAHPEHFRALNLPGVAARVPAEQQDRSDTWHDSQRRMLAAAQAAGAIAKMPLEDLVLAAAALVHGLSHMIVEGQLGEVSPARARELAIAVTGVFGLGLLPRSDADQAAASLGPYPPLPTSISTSASTSVSASASAPAPAPAADLPRRTRAAPRKGMRDVKPKR